MTVGRSLFSKTEIFICLVVNVQDEVYTTLTCLSKSSVQETNALLIQELICDSNHVCKLHIDRSIILAMLLVHISTEINLQKIFHASRNCYIVLLLLFFRNAEESKEDTA